MLYLFCLLHSGVFYATVVEIAKRHTNDRKYVLKILDFRHYIHLCLYLLSFCDPDYFYAHSLDNFCLYMYNVKSYAKINLAFLCFSSLPSHLKPSPPA